MAKPLPFIGVVDYGRGNLRSVSKALEHVGARVKVGASPLALRGAAGILLHGLVGYDAQPAGMQMLFYVVVLVAIAVGMWWVTPRSSPKAQRPMSASR